MTPGQDRILLVTVRGHEFGYRRPSRADLDDIARRLAAKLTPASGYAVESDLIAGGMGDAAEWEARFEICLVPRRKRDGSEIHLGERAPAHWLEGGAVSFANVMPDEFWEVATAFEKALAPPVPTSPASSSSSAGAPTNG